ncbi:hypothetical protein GGE16_001102 [Rhizobium leguminosarum]|uniref:Uncharacterized protein n=1 Tax=Rhizobium leguminosarum TaxID=384 RepID=A0AAE2MGT0_RHILE|nr:MULTISPECIES: hypothetical protein [Rhizobium]MBB4289086.1 hypothetical protein [Rhizobium leguminosarum]MBB4294821.1 hypothetical protein [Rhizobium leguminosarum]MBB4306214.1 hypothetical protein [Rhizobium leguminosarum]MBB4418205.1 hypothetical protein [Rhizobium leguminosarum]MBB4433051.1 hypothetical protein [Rhizobium esperanzae]
MDRQLPIFRQSSQDCSSPRWHDANIFQPSSQVNDRASFTAGDPIQRLAQKSGAPKLPLFSASPAALSYDFGGGRNWL